MEGKMSDDLMRSMRIMNEIAIPKIPINPNLASEFHSRLISMINDFHEKLDNEHEVGVRLVSFGQKITFHIESIGYWNPSLIRFNGFTEDGMPVELIQHVSQISIVLIKMKRKDPDKPKRPIGFSISDVEKGETEKFE
jgi:hypothetical protein